MLQEIKKIYAVSTAFAVGIAFLVFGLVWMVAPEVGGDWWPYIRFFVSVIPAVIASTLTFNVLLTTLSARLAETKIDELFDVGSENEPWTEENIESVFGADSVRDVEFEEVDEE